MTFHELQAEVFQLREENAQLRTENGRLLRENVELKKALKELEARFEELEREQKRQAAPFRRRDELKVDPKLQKKRGRKPGHPGAFRQPPKEFDETIIVTLDKCPHCAGEVEPRQMRTQFIEEIPPIKPHITRLVTWSGLCPQCGQVHSTHPLQTSLGQGAAGTQLGPRAQGLAVLLHEQYSVPMEKTCQILKQGFGLSLTSGGLSQLLDRVANKLHGQYDELLERIRQSDVVYADETSWYVGAAGYWLWVFTTPTSTVYRIAGSRGLCELLRQIQVSQTQVHLPSLASDQATTPAAQDEGLHLPRRLGATVGRSPGVDGAARRTRARGLRCAPHNHRSPRRRAIGSGDKADR